jgi:hypothetical protein
MAVTYFGDNTNGNTTGGRSADYQQALRFQNTAMTGNLCEIGMNIGDTDVGGGNLRMGVWADKGNFRCFWCGADGRFVPSPEREAEKRKAERARLATMVA